MDANSIKKLLRGRVPVRFAASAFTMDKDSQVKQLIHLFKYSGEQEIGKYLATELALAIDAKIHRQFDVIVAVPLHPKKKKIRGFNQAEVVAQVLGRIWGIPVDCSALIRQRHAKTQTRKNRLERWENVKSDYLLNKGNALEGKHILLVDDVITTGATMEACWSALCSIKEIKISVASLAFAP